MSDVTNATNKTALLGGYKMTVLEYMKDNILFLDGGMGTLLQKRGLAAGELPEVWNITHPDVIESIHLEYYNSGSKN